MQRGHATIPSGTLGHLTRAEVDAAWELTALSRLLELGERWRGLAVPAGFEERFYRLNSLPHQLLALYRGLDPTDPDEDIVEEAEPAATAMVTQHYLLDESVDLLYDSLDGDGPTTVRRAGREGGRAATGRRAVPLAADAADEAAAGPAVRAAAAALGGPVDILVNNAGIEEVRAAAEVEAALWDRILGVNLRGAFFMARAAARELLAAGRGGAIVNVCSLTSYVGVPAAAPYTASKAGLLGLTRALAAEWAASGIRVNGIAPGYFRTALTEPFYADDAWQARMLAKIPMGRFGALDDLAGAAVFLAADASRYMTGQCLVIDGGYLASI